MRMTRFSSYRSIPRLLLAACFLTFLAGGAAEVRAHAAFDPPVSNGIGDVNVLEDASPTVVDLFSAFDDPEDPDNALTFTVVSNTNPGLVATSPISAQGELTLTYTANQWGSSTITVRATDTENLSVEESFDVNITPVNDAPSFNVGFSPSISEDAGPQTINNWATGISAGPNEGGQSLSFALSATNSGMFSVQPAVSANGTLTYTPASNATGTSTVTITLSDDGGTANGGDNDSDPQTFTITISNSNDPPTTSGISNVNVLEDADDVVINLFSAFDDAEDQDNELDYNITLNTDPSLFRSTNINENNGNLRLRFAADANGSSILQVEATDTGGLSVTATFTVVVTPVNDAPSFSKGPNLTVNAGAPMQNIPNWATNIDPGAPNESFQSLSFSVSTPDAALFSTPPSLSSTGTLVFRPAQNTSGTASINVVLADNGGTSNGGSDTSAPQSFTITVANSNGAPTTSGIADINGDEDDPTAVINLFAAFADNEDPDAALTYNVQQNTNPGLFTGGTPAINPSAGTLTLNFTPDAFGTSTLTVRATDTGGLFVDTSFDVTLASVNDAPSFTVGPNQTVAEDAPPQTASGWAKNISAGPANESSQSVSFNVSNDNAALFSEPPAINGNGALTYTPQADAFGVATVSVFLKDDGGTQNGGVDTSPTSQFTITITPSNDPPLVEDDNYLLPEGQSLAASAGGNPPGVLDNDFDPDGDTLVPTVLEEPKFSSTWSFNSNGSFFYLHDGSENIVDTFTYEVTDGTVTSREVTVTITIIPENDPPVAGTISDIRLKEDAADTPIPLFDAFDDPDDADADLTFSVTNVTNPALFDNLNNGSINPQTGVLTLDFLKDVSGFSTVTVRATDPVGAFAETSFDVELTPVNDAPSMTIQGSIDLDEDPGLQTLTEWATNISPGPPDESNQVVTASVTNVSNPTLFSAQPSFVINGANGTLSFNPAPQLGGISEVTITLQDTGGITDGGENTATYTFTITIRGDNDPPTSAGIEDIQVVEDGSIDAFNLFTVFDDVEDADSLLTFTLESEINDTLFQQVSIAGSPPILTIALAGDAFGSSTVSVRATDTEGLWAQEDIQIDILPVNDPPSFSKGPDIALQQNSITQLIPDWATDISVGPENESDQLPNFVILSNNNEALFQTLPAISPEGSLTFEPSPSSNAYGTAILTYALFDTGGTENGGVDQSPPDTFSISLNRFNTPPSSNNDNYIVDQGQTLQRDASSGVLANDTDPEGDPVTAKLITPPVNGDLTLNPDGSFIYRHNNSLTTNDQFTYVANDGFEDSDEAEVTISIQPLNTLFLQEVVVAEDADVTRIDIRDQLALSLSAGYRFDLTSVSNPTLFSDIALDSLNGVLRLTYAANQNGFSTLNISAVPQQGEIVRATQNVTIIPVNDTPIAVQDIAATIENTPVLINVLSNDVDFDNDELNVPSFTQPSIGRVDPRSTGTFLYTPPEGFTGEVTFTYVVEDDSLSQDVGDVMITVFSGRFNVTLLELPETATSAGYSISNAGEVVGVSQRMSGRIQAFSSDQELPSDQQSEASGANDFGQVVGSMSLPAEPVPGSSADVFSFFAALWDSTGTTNLGAFDNRASKAYSINNEGRIVGTSTWGNEDVLRGFLWESGQMKELESLPEAESQAFSINERGQVAGYDGMQATLWNGSRVLRRLEGPSGRAYDLNENGEAVGSIDDGTVKAVFWNSNGARTSLPVSSSPFSEAYSINNSNWVVGTYMPAETASKHAAPALSGTPPRWSQVYRPVLLGNETSRKQSSPPASATADETGSIASSNEAMRAFLWQGGQLVDLNDFIDPESGWVLLEARGINNAAQITGIGLFNGQRRAFVLAPTNNKAPTAIDDLVLLTGLESIQIAVTANDLDEDGDALQIVEVTQGESGTVSLLDGQTLVYTPGPQFTYTDTFTYVVADERGGRDEGLVTVESGRRQVPKTHFLAQNYPNPFNPTTTIRFGIPAQARVQLEVFNSIGQHVATLVDEVREAGEHQVVFKADQLPGGVYFYRIRTERFTKTHRFVLLK